VSPTLETAPQETLEALSQAAANFATIASDLLQGYDALQLRATRIERELEASNAELAARLSEVDRLNADLAALLAALPCGVIVRGSDGSIRRSNPAAAALLGASAESIGTAWAELRTTTSLDPAGRLVWNSPGGGTAVLAERNVRLPGADGGLLQILDDQTALAELEARMQSATKMAALGTLAAGIAHEIRNPLNAVGGFGDLLAQRLPVGSKERHWAGLISAGVVEANRIITGLLHFARPGEIALSRLELRPLLEELISLSAGHPAHGRGVQVELQCPHLTVEADAQKLRQALRNLLENALDWSPPGGQVRLSAWRSGAEVAVAVEDSGPGVNPADAPHLFEPFFTTRPEGTGLGLALAHTIAGLHQGRLTVDPHHSELGGARFLFRWLTTGEAPPNRAGNPGNSTPAKTLP
jgi:signal transduction histidine kinase